MFTKLAQVPEHTKIVGDALSVTTVVATIAGLLPAIAALLTIVWTAIRIYETKTVQCFFKRFKKNPQ